VLEVGRMPANLRNNSNLKSKTSCDRLKKLTERIFQMAWISQKSWRVAKSALPP